MIEVGHIQMSDDTAELFEALAKAQSSYQPVSKDRIADIQSKKGDASSYQYSYATLDTIWDEVRPHLTENGICTIQSPFADGNSITVTTLLGHLSGQWIAGSVTLQATDSTPQGAGSAMTYARRYSLQGIVGVTPESDDDALGAAGLGASASTKSKSKTVCPKCGKATIIKDSFGSGWICWKKEGRSDGCGAKFDMDPASSPPADKPPADKSQKKETLGEWGEKLKELIEEQTGNKSASAWNAFLSKATNIADVDAVEICKDEEQARIYYEILAEKHSKKTEAVA